MNTLISELVRGQQQSSRPVRDRIRCILLALMLVAANLLGVAVAPEGALAATAYPASNPYPAPNCNCTWWAWQAWHNMGVNLPSSGNAYQWSAITSAQMVSSGQVAPVARGSAPQVNALAVFPRSVEGSNATFGHVAVVTSVGAGGSFSVSQESSGGPCGVHSGTYHADSRILFLYLPGGTVDIARSVVLASNAHSGYVFDLSGGIHPFGGAPVVGINGYWTGQDMIRGAALSTDTSGYTLDRQGGLHPFGGAAPVTVSGYWPGQDLARGVVLRRDGHSGYVLDAYGGLSPFGGAPWEAVSGYWAGQDIARSVVLASNGHSGYVFDLSGGIHPFGGAPPVAITGYWAGQDMIRGATLATDSSGYTLDRQGGMHPFGGAPPVAITGYWPSDTARALAMRGAVGYALDRCGGLSPIGGAIWEPVSGYWC